MKIIIILLAFIMCGCEVATIEEFSVVEKVVHHEDVSFCYIRVKGSVDRVKIRTPRKDVEVGDIVRIIKMQED